MTSRSATLVVQFMQTHADFVRLIEGLSDEDWLKVPPGEQRTVSAVAYHTAEGYAITLRLGKMIASGEPLPEFAPEQMHALNARQAAEHADVTRAEVLALLEVNAAVVAAGLYEMTDEQLSQKRSFFGHEAAAGDGIAFLTIRHIGEHAASIRAVVQPEARPVPSV